MEPFWNLWDMAGTLMILSVFALIVWILGALPFLYVVLIAVLFFTAVFFANKGSPD
jgi:hypothetical protein